MTVKEQLAREKRKAQKMAQTIADLRRIRDAERSGVLQLNTLVDGILAVLAEKYGEKTPEGGKSIALPADDIKNSLQSVCVRAVRTGDVYVITTEPRKESGNEQR